MDDVIHLYLDCLDSKLSWFMSNMLYSNNNNDGNDNNSVLVMVFYGQVWIVLLVHGCL